MPHLRRGQWQDWRGRSISANPTLTPAPPWSPAGQATHCSSLSGPHPTPHLARLALPGRGLGRLRPLLPEVTSQQVEPPGPRRVRWSGTLEAPGLGQASLRAPPGSATAQQWVEEAVGLLGIPAGGDLRELVLQQAEVRATPGLAHPRSPPFPELTWQREGRG